MKSNGKYYHVKKGGKLTTNKKIKYKKKYYIAAKNGEIYTRIFTWKKNIYYSSGKGVLRTKKGFVTYNGSRYYVRKGGKIYKNKLFKVGGKKYLAMSDGHIGTGLYIWKSKRYITNAKGAIIAKEGLYSYNGKTYYVKSSGVIPSNTFDTYKEKHYYSGSDGAIVKSAFSYKGITIHPNSQTGEISMEDYVKVFPNAAPKEVDG
jgi:glucan-binding YG repeat protein